ncbi:uncharacterized protein PFL1_01819 [Pseudozyma flocculosa PF-1]|uniref:uncharacterized protein n=1 Tax=Pseudozyma flocculosa PF-1 TaxID=1277687 RepID=UPI0004560FC4|nr:uncharacterized protein PFL1_01819 [Pseudozyma flocculosa PF-1]EPQ30921.1 hypothetical protein PFL1_01819 [Pseudozyma flocculosa PF-1]
MRTFADLLPSPPSTPLTTTSVTIVDQRTDTSPTIATPNADAGRAAPGGELSYTNVDGTTRVYRFPQQMPARSPSAPTDRDGRSTRSTAGRVVTVRDLRNKSCWICSEEDEDQLDVPPPSAADPALAAAQGRGRRRRFVHPCNCTLVAHESCLLAWIDQSRINHPTQDTVTCPQCKAPYILIDPKPVALRLLEQIDKLVAKAVPLGCVSVLGGSVLIACTAYGCVALRLVLGRDASQRLLAPPWPWHFWFDIPAIPFALVASKLRIAETATTWLPTVLVYSLNQFPLLTTDWMMERWFEHRGATRSYPPGPTLMALLIPWIRQAYLALKRRTYRAVLGPFLRKRRAERRNNGGASSGGGGAAAPGIRRRRVVVDALTGDDDYDDDGDDDGARAGGGGAATARTVFISHRYIGRLCLDALSLPLVASAMGKLLALLARHNGWLARILGMEAFLGRRAGKRGGSVLSSFYTTTTTGGSATASSRDSAKAAQPSPIGGLFRGRLPSRDESYGDGDEDAAAALRRRLGIAPTVSYDDLDPVWFRNAVGAGLFIVVKDAASLLHKYLKLRQRGRTTVADLPFGPGLVEGLDLREGA